MGTLYYGPFYAAVPDSLAESVARQVFLDDHYVSTENVIWALKALLAEDYCSPDDVSLNYNGNTIALNEYGAWPNDEDEKIFDYGGHFAVRILTASNKKRKEKRNALHQLEKES